MYNFRSFITRICKLMSICVVFALVVFPMHDEMDAHSLEKDIIIQAHVNSIVENRAKKVNLDIGTYFKSFLQTFYHKPDRSKMFFIISFSSPLNLVTSTILNL